MQTIIPPERIKLALGSTSHGEPDPVEYIRVDLYDNLFEMLDRAQASQHEMLDKLGVAQQRIEDLASR